MQLQTVLSASGPLPQKASFTPELDGPVVLILTATAWSSAANNVIGVVLSLNGAQIGSVSMYANQGSVHMTLPTLFANGTITSSQPQTVTISALGNTTTDVNDKFTVQLLI